MQEIFDELSRHFSDRNDIRLVYVPFFRSERTLSRGLAEDTIEVYHRGKLATVITETELFRTESPRQLISHLL